MVSYKEQVFFGVLWWLSWLRILLVVSTQAMNISGIQLRLRSGSVLSVKYV